jgi:hypothetical protein
VHLKFILEGTKVNKENYKEVLVHLLEVIHLMHHEIWVAKV